MDGAWLPRGARDRPGSAMQRMGSIEVTGLTRDLPGTDNGTLALADYGAILGGSALRCFSTGIEYDAKRPYLVPNAESTRADAFDRSGLWLHAEDDTYTETRGSAAQSCTGYLDATALTAVAV